MNSTENPNTSVAYIEAIRFFTPVSEYGGRSAMRGADIWGGRNPLPHEESLMAAYVSLIEKEARGVAISPEEISHSRHLLAWIAGIEPKENQNKSDCLREAGKKEEIRSQVMRLNEEDFLGQSDAGRVLTGFFPRSRADFGGKRGDSVSGLCDI